MRRTFSADLAEFEFIGFWAAAPLPPWTHIARRLIAGTLMKYQVIFQFPDSFFVTLDELTAFEAKLITSLPKTCDVDGYDTGSGTTNFFVYTDTPLAAFTSFRTYLGTNKVEKNLRVSYRDVEGDSYINLWPYRDPRPFDIVYPEGVDPFSAKSKRSIPRRSPPGVSKFETPAADEWPT